MNATGIAFVTDALRAGLGPYMDPENRLRHPRFAGIRSDKDAGEVVREEN